MRQANSAFGRASMHALKASVYGAALMTALAGQALAQDTAAPEQGAAEAPPEGVAQTEAPEIFVTASRARSGFAAPTPTQIVGAGDLERRGATNIASIIQDVPAFGTKNLGDGNGGRPSTVGQNFADLRGLGSFRTLVLVDGRRVVPQVPASNITNPYQVDLNVIPSLMLERVEIVTGGASAQWGSDAVAGVVNLILRKEYSGLRGEIQGGVSEAGDGAEFRIGLIGGTSFAGGRGHVLVAGDYVRNDGLSGSYGRDWAARAYGQASDPTATAANGLPIRVTIDDAQVGNRTPGGLITSVTAPTSALAATMLPLLETNFLTATTTAPFVRGGFNQVVNTSGTTTRTRSFQAIQQGGLYPRSLTHIDLIAPLERRSLSGRASFEFSDAVQLWAQASYADSSGVLHGNATSDTGGVYNPATGSGSQVRIYADNPFIPVQLRPFIPAPALASTPTPPGQSFVMSRINYDFGDGTNEVRNSVYSGAIGLEGDIGGGWHWDASYGYGRNKYVRTATLQRDRALYTLAADAIVDPANPSRIICRSTLTNPANGCVPVNLFGVGSPSAAAIDYFTDTTTAQNIYTQHAAQANLQGSPFNTWAGPVALAAGVEWRSETIAVTSDAKTPTGVYDTTGATSPFSGSFNVREGYIEAVVPLATDLPFAHWLAVNGAIRYADYSNSGGATTWKVGATYEPVSGILLRGAYSRDLRAPSLYEQFLPATTNFISQIYRGTTYTGVRQTSSGNPGLEPEIARTLTLGVSLSPRFAPGLRVSLDYYRIKLEGAIAIAGAATIVQNCENGLTSFCDQLVFATPGNIATALVGVNDRFLNFSRFFTRGLDFNLDYSTSLFSGELSLRGNVSYVPTFQTITPGAAGAPDTTREYAGGVGAGNSSAFPVPKWKGTASMTYSDEGFSLTGQMRYVGSGRQSTIFTEAPTTTAPADIAPADNHIGSYAVFSLAGTINVLSEGRAQFFWVVNNLFGRDPPPIPNTTLQTQVNGSNYDVIGRYYRIGVRFRL